MEPERRAVVHELKFASGHFPGCTSIGAAELRHVRVVFLSFVLSFVIVKCNVHVQWQKPFASICLSMVAADIIGQDVLHVSYTYIFHILSMRL